MFGKTRNSQFEALKKLGPAEMDYSDEDAGATPDNSAPESERVLGTKYHKPLSVKRDEGQAKHVGRIGDLNPSPEPKLATKPYGSDDGQAPNQSKTRTEAQTKQFGDKGLARVQHPGSDSHLGEGDFGSDVEDDTNVHRDERHIGVSRLGNPIPPGYKRGQGEVARGPK